jgi:hypothetical protein
MSLILLQVPGPSGGWRLWRSKVQKQQEGEVDQAWAAHVMRESCAKEGLFGGCDDEGAASEEKQAFRQVRGCG